MNMLRISSLVAVCLLLFIKAFPASGQSGIIVDGAETLRTISIAPSTSLNNLLEDVPSRIVAQYANALRSFDIAAPPDKLQSLLTDVPAQPIFAYANSNINIPLVYPRELLNDITAPVSNSLQITFGANSTSVTWTTNEFALCTLRYGTQSGNYTNMVESLLYEKQHSVQLNNLTPGTIYYGQLVCTDQSGNSSTSTEFVIQQEETPNNILSLPLLRK